jgi:NifU-like protein involved in Fe-S cluster formation
MLFVNEQHKVNTLFVAQESWCGNVMKCQWKLFIDEQIAKFGVVSL